MTKDQQKFMEQYVQMMANHQAEIEGRIRDARLARLQIQRDFEEDKAAKEQAANEEREIRERIAEYYACVLDYPNFAISAQEIIEDHFNGLGVNLWNETFRMYGEFSTTNPFYQMSLEQRLFFIGISDLKMSAGDGQIQPILSPLLDGLQLKDVMAHFKPIEETSGTFADEIPKIREKLALFKDSLGNVE